MKNTETIPSLSQGKTGQQLLYALFTCLILFSMQSVNAMPMASHINGLDDLGGMKDLIGTPVSEGGVGSMTIDRIRSISGWMDNPASKTGQYRNWYDGGNLVSPSNHNALRHNPENVAKVFSGKKGIINEGDLNAARMHKIQDVAHNTQPVDGWKITPQMREEAQEMLRHVDQNGSLPEKRPIWVDKSGPLIRNSENVSLVAVSKISKVGKVLAGVGVLAAGFQVYEGVQELKQGQTGKGALNITGSAASATSTAAYLAGKYVLCGSAAAIGVGIDGGTNLYDGVKNHKPEKTAIGSVKLAAAVAMGAGTATAQPEIAFPAAVVYGGAVVTDVAYDNRQVIEETAYAVSVKTKELAIAGYEKTKSGLSTASAITIATCTEATATARENIDETAAIIYDHSQKLRNWF
jgi:hypothetical protein